MVSFGLLTEQSRWRGFFPIGRNKKANIGAVGKASQERRIRPLGEGTKLQTNKSKHG